MTTPRAALASIAALSDTRLKRYRSVAREAQATYVGRHWPSMRDMRRDGIGSGLVEDRANEARIRRYLDTFQPEMLVAMLDAWLAERVTRTLADEGLVGDARTPFTHYDPATFDVDGVPFPPHVLSADCWCGPRVEQVLADETADDVERLADAIHEARCGPVLWKGNEHVPWSDDHREWDIATAKALGLLGVTILALAKVPHG